MCIRDRWETASGGRAVVCVGTGRTCAASHGHSGPAGPHDIVVQYFDERDGSSRLRLVVAGREVDAWIADADLPTDERNGHSSTRRIIRGVQLAPGDTLRIEAVADGGEGASIDYVEIVAASPDR